MRPPKGMRDYMSAVMETYRAQRGMSQELMAESVGISTRAYADIARRISAPSAYTMVRYLLLLPHDDVMRILCDLQDICDAADI